MKRIIIIIYILANVSDTNCQVEYIGFSGSAGVIHNRQNDNGSSQFLVKDNPAFTYTAGLIFHFNGFALGLNQTFVKCEREIQGVFPENGLYGLASVETQINYWSMPVSVKIVEGRHSAVSLTYTPDFTGFYRQDKFKFGGAETSEYINNYSELPAGFHHSLVCSFVSVFGRRGSIFAFALKPYFGIGSGFYKYQKQIVTNVVYGLNINLLFEAENLSIEFSKKQNPSWSDKENQLKEKQKEIENKIKKQ